MPTVIEKAYRDNFPERIDRLIKFYWAKAGSNVDTPTDSDQWACSFATELRNLELQQLSLKDMKRIIELERIAIKYYGYNANRQE
jgi:hypothetical protein